MHSKKLSNEQDQLNNTYLQVAQQIKELCSNPNIVNEQLLFQKLMMIPYFKSFAEQLIKDTHKDTVIKICSKFKLLETEKGQLLFSEGEVSNNKLYIILQGSVVLMKRKLNEAGRPSLHYENQIQVLHDLNQSVKNKYQQSLSNYGYLQRILEVGEGFGEKALIENKTRTLTAFSNENCLFLTLEKQDFDEVKEGFEQQIKIRKELLFNLFDNVINEYSSARLEQMVYSLKVKELERNQVLTKNEQKGDCFYLLEMGELFIFDEKRNNLPIAIITPGELIGEEIVVKQDSTYSFTGVVKTCKAILLTINKMIFMAQFPVECRQCILDVYQKKIEARKQKNDKLESNESIRKISLGKGKKKLNRLKESYNEKGLEEKKILQSEQEKLREEYNSNWNRSSISLFNKVKGQRMVEKIGKEKNKKGFEIDGIISSTDQMFGRKKVEIEIKQFDFGRGEIEKQEQKDHFFKIMRGSKKLKFDYLRHNENLSQSAKRLSQIRRDSRIVQNFRLSEGQMSSLESRRYSRQSGLDIMGYKSTLVENVIDWRLNDVGKQMSGLQRKKKEFESLGKGHLNRLF